MYSSHFGAGPLTTVTATPMTNEANHGAAFNQLQHLRHNNEREIEDEEATEFAPQSCSNSLQRPPRQKYRGIYKFDMCLYI